MICRGLTREQANRLYLEVLEAKDDKALRRLAQEDLFFLLTVGCKRKDADHDWLYGNCREVEAEPDGYLDLWAREHFKSSTITFALTIKDILNDPNITVGIFSHTRPIAKAFLSQIKQEFEQNTFLKSLFPDVLWAEPKSQAPKWSLDSGIIVKRDQNPKESTIEAWGLVDGQPTSKHFALMVYDDVVTRESVSTTEQIKKTTAAWELSTNLGAQGGKKRYIGTRYHANDTYKVMMDRGSVKVRLKPAREGGTMEGRPVFMSDELLIEKRRDQGPYTFGCFPAGAPVLMSDWSERKIEEINVGDEVVGYSFPSTQKSRLVKSRVKAINTRLMPVYEYKFESGRVVRCTKEHKWFTGRRGKDVGGTDDHKAYASLGFEKASLKSLISVYDPRSANRDFDEVAAGWLAGFFDGEGSTSGNCIHFHQTSGKNLVVCEKLEANLKKLEFDFGITQMQRKNKWEPIRDYYLRGGREESIRFLRQCSPARSHKIIKMLYDTGTRNFGKVSRDKLVSMELIGSEPVYNMETETGNYICYGYATKNSQMLLNPTADKSMGFKPEWLCYYKSQLKIEDLNIYLLVDPASEKKDTSDYTVMKVIGLGPDNNYYLVDAIRDRMNLTERTEKLFFFHRKYKPLKVGYEKYGKDSDIEHIKYVMEEKNYRFDITPVGGQLAKEDRIKRLVPIFEQKRMWLPERMHFTDYEGRSVDYIHSFVNDEYLAFPVCVHDDMLDCMARILDPLMSAEFPKEKKTQAKPQVYRGPASWMG